MYRIELGKDDRFVVYHAGSVVESSRSFAKWDALPALRCAIINAENLGEDVLINKEVVPAIVAATD